ncbi:MAG: PKD domain-containing protein [Bacteroidetes bacterium]|nr:MAG: PKD domain-containing protein [Bacteroidota bacterium]
MHKLLKYLLALLLLNAVSSAKGQLVADFDANPRSGCAPIRVVFSDSSKGGATAWRWDLGNGTITTAQNPSTTYFTPGVFNIRLTVYRGTDSATVTKTRYISVFARPTVFFSGKPTNGCIVLPVQFKDSSVAGSGTLTSWQWDFGDGNLSNQQNPLHNYGIQGNFQVTLTVRNSEGCTSSDSKLNYINVNDSIRARFKFNQPTACTAPVPVVFTDSSIGASVVRWRWDFGDGGTSTQKNPTHNYTTAGIYTVRLIIENNTGCTDTMVLTNAVSAGIFRANYTGPTSICTGKAAVFTNTSSPLALLDSTRWHFGDGSTSRVRNPSKIYGTTGTYTITQISYFGACVDSIKKTIDVVVGPKADFTAMPRGACKPPLTVNFTNTSTGATSYLWDFSGSPASQPNPTITFTSQGSFGVRLIASSGNGCFDTLFRPNYIVIADPVINGIEGAPYKGCLPYTRPFRVITNLSEPIVAWAWDFGDGGTSTDSTPTHTYSAPGTYTISVKITTQSGCTATFSSIIAGGPKPKANFAGAPRLVCPEEQVYFTDSSSGANEWFWRFGDGGTSKEQNPTYQYQDTGWMNVTLIAINNGCADTLRLTKYIYVNPPLARFLDSFSCSNQFERFFIDTSVGALTWKWNFGNYDSTTTRHANYVFPDTGRIPVMLTVADSFCKHSTTKFVLILDEKANFVFADSGNCAQTRVKLTAQGPKTHPWNIKRYVWDFGDGFPITTTTNTIERDFSTPGVVNIRLRITDLNDCEDEITKPITVRLYGPEADFGPRFQAACAGSFISFTDSSRFDKTNPLVKWTWNFGFGADTTFTGPEFGRVYPNPGVYDVRLMVTDSLGCTNTIVKPRAVVIYKPSANFISADTLVCVNSPVRFTNRSTGSLLRYNWRFDNNDTSTIANPTTSYSLEGRYTISLVVQDTLNCTDSLVRPLYITVANAKASFAISDSFTTCPPLLVKFTNESLNNRQNFWTFGNGNTSTLLTPSHTYTTPGTFRAMLRVVGNGGCTDTISQQIRIQGPSGTINYGPLIGCPPLAVSFSSTAINTKFYTWDFNDGSSTFSADSTAKHLYLLPGTFVPRLILEDGLGCKLPVPGPDSVKVLGAKSLISKLQNNYYCDSAVVQFLDSTITNDIITNYKWTFGDGDTSNQRNPKHVYKRPGRYIVSLRVTTATGCVTYDTLSVPVIIVGAPQLAIGSDTAVCLPSTVQHRARWLNPDTTTLRWRWTLANGNSNTSPLPPPISYNRPGTYAVSVIATNQYGCADTITQTLLVNDTPRVVAAPYTYLCLGASVRLTASGAQRYSWNPNPELSCLNCATPTASPTRSRIYNVVGIDTNNCQSSDTVLVRVVQPTRMLAGPGDTICVGEAVRLGASGKVFYSWSPSTGLSSTAGANVMAKPTITTTYRVVGADSLNCFTDTAYYPVVVFPIPTVDIIDSRIVENTGNAILLRTTASPDVIRWTWSPATNLSCTTCPQPIASIIQPITYTATVYNEGLCTAVDRVTVTPLCNGDNIFIPNTFSPNGDGQNDYFLPRGKGLSSIKSMKIFSRWGEVMFERKDFGVNNERLGWDGTYRGQLLTPDVYVYLIEVICDNSVTMTLKGNVTLLK